MDQTTQNMIWRISDQKVLQLIDLYEQEEFLWDSSVPNYRRRHYRKKATERIAKALNIKDFTYSDVAKKFQNIRRAYKQELMKIAKSINSGEDPIYRPKVFWFTKIDGFLRPHVPATTGTIPQLNPGASSQEENKSPLKIKKEDEDSFSFEEHDVEYAPPTKRSKIESPINTESVLDDNIDSYISNHSEVSQSLGLTLNEDNPFDSHNSRPDVSKNSKYLEDIAKCLSNFTKNNTQRDDCFESFGKYVAAMLRSMSKRRALEVQPEIVKLLVSGNLDSDEGQVSQSDQPNS